MKTQKQKHRTKHKKETEYRTKKERKKKSIPALNPVCTEGNSLKTDPSEKERLWGVAV